MTKAIEKKVDTLKRELEKLKLELKEVKKREIVLGKSVLKLLKQK